MTHVKKRTKKHSFFIHDNETCQQGPVLLLPELWSVYIGQNFTKLESSQYTQIYKFFHHIQLLCL